MADRVATNVRLERAQLHALKQLALDRGLSLAGLFQEIVDDCLARSRTLAGKAWKCDPFFQLGHTAARSGRSRVSEDHNRYLYPRRTSGRPKRSSGQQALR
jgi:hypothetical protein